MPTTERTDETIERVSTVEAVFRTVMRLALTGRLAPGAPLREGELAERFSVGRHSVRAALQIAAREGIAVYHQNRGVFVREFSAADVEDIYLLRQALESEAVRLIHERRLPRRLVDEALAQLARLPSDAPLDEAILADLEVHRALVAEVGSERLTHAFDSVMVELRLALAQAQVEYEDPDALLSDHEQLIERLWTLPLTAAQETIRANCARSVADIQQAMGLTGTGAAT